MNAVARLAIALLTKAIVMASTAQGQSASDFKTRPFGLDVDQAKSPRLPDTALSDALRERAQIATVVNGFALLESNTFAPTMYQDHPDAGDLSAQSAAPPR